MVFVQRNEQSGQGEIEMILIIVAAWFALGVCIFFGHVYVLEKDFRRTIDPIYKWQWGLGKDAFFLIICVLAGPIGFPTLIYSVIRVLQK